MDQPLPIAIAAWSAAFTLGAVMAGAVAVTIASSVARPATLSLSSAAGRAAGAAIMLAIPIAVAAFFSIFGSALLIAVGTPPIAYPFVAMAGLAGLYAAHRAPHGSDAQGCNRLVGLFAGAYVAVWGGVSFWLLGGPADWPADLASLRWLQPPLAAAIFAGALALIGKGQRSVWLFLGGMAFFSGWLALAFFPIEAGFAAAWLPASDWLRFPLAGVALGTLLAAVPTGLQLAQKRPARPARRRMLRQHLLFAALGAAMGLVWAAARALVAAL